MADYPGYLIDGRGKAVSSEPIITPGEKAAAKLAFKYIAKNEKLEDELYRMKGARNKLEELIRELEVENEQLRKQLTQCKSIMRDYMSDELIPKGNER